MSWREPVVGPSSSRTSGRDCVGCQRLAALKAAAVRLAKERMAARAARKART